jgi:hypothetical protein
VSSSSKRPRQSKYNKITDLDMAEMTKLEKMIVSLAKDALYEFELYSNGKTDTKMMDHDTRQFELIRSSSMLTAYCYPAGLSDNGMTELAISELQAIEEKQRLIMVRASKENETN